MKRVFVFAIILLLLAGCAPQYPLNANLNPRIPSQGGEIYRAGTTASIQAIDSRKNPEVLVYLPGNDPAVGITNLSPPHILISERLAGGLRQQGLLIESSSQMSILVDINELVATVIRPKVLYMTKATSSIQLVLRNNGETLTKNYNLVSNRESLTKPKVNELEELLNIQISDIVDQILSDKNIRNFLNEE
jgi:uncharacterized lipoprotein